MAVQIQATIPFDSFGVRINAADPLLIALLPLAAITHKTMGELLRERWVRGLLWALAAGTAVLTISYAIGVARGGLGTWATIKLVGWFVLLVYLLLGLLIGLGARSSGRHGFVAAFVGFQLLLMAIYLVSQSLRIELVTNTGDRFTGLAANPNVMALYAVCALALGLAYIGRTRGPRLASWLTYFVVGLALACVLFTKSTAGLFAAMAIMSASVLRRRGGWRLVLSGALIGVSLYAGATLAIERVAAGGSALKKLGYLTAFSLDGGSENESVPSASMAQRIESYRLAGEMWLADPVLGAGLGQHIRAQLIEHPEQEPVQVHSTPLWLATETGTTGLIVFGMMFVLVWRRLRWLSDVQTETPTRDADFAAAILLALLGWAVMSLFHELMYQRALWLLIGLALAIDTKGRTFEHPGDSGRVTAEGSKTAEHP